MHLEPGTDGGCVTFGPFKDFKVHMGPLQTMLQIPGGLPRNLQADGLGYNSRYLRRDISLQAAISTSDYDLVSFIKNNKDNAKVHAIHQGEFAKDSMGVHTGDQHTWNLDLKSREKALAGSAGRIAEIGTKDATQSDELVMGPYLGYPNVTIGDVMSTVGGPFCYIYA
ncbi:tyrosinase central domain-containing protein [Stagonosporopsis vannaccii]|nr:tyrosinase central domain-containing protein [Stagonosporopsis vannaccii]